MCCRKKTTSNYFDFVIVNGIIYRKFAFKIRTFFEINWKFKLRQLNYILNKFSNRGIVDLALLLCSVA